MTSRGGSCRTAVLVCVALFGAAACSSSSGKGSTSVATSTSTTATATTQPRPAGPVATMSQELTGGKGVFIGSATPANVTKVGYVEHEYVAAGTATSY